MPVPKRVDLIRLSRDRRFLVRAAMVISGAALVAAFCFSFLTPATTRVLASQTLEKWHEISSNPGNSTESWLLRIRFAHLDELPFLADARYLPIGGRSKQEVVFSESAADSSLPENEFLLLQALDRGLNGNETEAVVSEVESFPAETPLRSEVLGDLHFSLREWTKAKTYYLAQVEATSERRYSLRSAVVAAGRAGEHDSVSELLGQTSFHSAFTGPERMRLYADARAFRPLAIEIVRFEVRSLFTPSAIVALFSALIWYSILMSFWTPTRARLIASLLAFLAGAFSAFLTLFVVLLQERIQGFVLNPSDTPLNQFIYYLAGVSLREETLKLLCFLPFAFWTARRGSEIEPLLLASMVGLGFAFQENIAYFAGREGQITWLRFLTANVLHFSLTGLAGYYLAATIRRKLHGIENFLLAFIAVVFAHAVYNSVIAIPSLESYAIFSFILIALFAYFFFDPLREKMDIAGIHQRVSPLGVFVLGCAFLASLVLLSAAATIGFRGALVSYLSSLMQLIPLAFAFISRFRDL